VLKRQAISFGCTLAKSRLGEPLVIPEKL